MDATEAKALEFLDDYAASVVHWTGWTVKRRWWEPQAGPYDGEGHIEFDQGGAMTRVSLTHKMAQSLLPTITHEPRYKRIYIKWLRIINQNHIGFKMTVAPEDPVAIVDTLTTEQLHELRKRR